MPSSKLNQKNSQQKSAKTKNKRQSRSVANNSAEALDRVSADLLKKVPPHNLEAEQAVLGGIFLRNDIMHSILDIIHEDDFYSPANRYIFQAFVELYRQNRPLDLISVSNHLRGLENIDEVGGSVYLANLTQSVPSAANAAFHAQIVKDKSIRRSLIQTSTEILEQTFDATQEVDKLLDEAEQKIFAVTESQTKPIFRSSKDLVEVVFEQLTERAERKELVTGVPSGFHGLDLMTAGFQPTDLIIIAARPSMGKTAFALSLAMQAAVAAATPTAVFSLEMSMEQLMMRMLCSWGKVDLSKLRSGFIDDGDWSRLYHAAESLSEAPLYIDDTAALSTLELRARCRRLKAERKLGLVIVDYLQLMRASRRIDSREQEISDISRTLKALAKEMHVPVIALSQLNRKVEERTNKRPMLSDLRESGAIEQDADLILFLYRDAAYNKDPDNPNKNLAEVIVGKQRNGPTGVTELTYLSPYTAFENKSDIPEPSENM